MRSFQVVEPDSGKRPSARYGHTTAAQRHLQPLYSSFGIPSESSELFGEESIYIHGGMLPNGSVSAELWQFQLKTSSWRQLPSSPLAVADHAMVSVDNRWLVVHGGQCDARHGSITIDMYVYDSMAETWEQVHYKAGKCDHVCCMYVRQEVALYVPYVRAPGSSCVCTICTYVRK